MKKVSQIIVAAILGASIALGGFYAIAEFPNENSQRSASGSRVPKSPTFKNYSPYT